MNRIWMIWAYWWSVAVKSSRSINASGICFAVYELSYLRYAYIAYTKRYTWFTIRQFKFITNDAGFSRWNSNSWIIRPLYSSYSDTYKNNNHRLTKSQGPWHRIGYCIILTESIISHQTEIKFKEKTNFTCTCF